MVEESRQAEPQPVTYTDFQVAKLKKWLSIAFCIIIAIWVIFSLVGHEHKNLFGNTCSHRHFILPTEVIFDGHIHGINEKENCFR